MPSKQITPEMKRRILSWIRGVFLGMVGCAALLVISSGKWDWFWGWVYATLLTLAMVTHLVVLLPINPALLVDRAGGMRQPGAKRWDIWLTTIAGLAFFSIMIVAGLDERWGWTGTISTSWHIAGILLFVIWWIFFLWAMASNPFFSESVRIQENHQVAQRGPYRFVRHPGYFGNLIGCIGQPLLLGSWWAFIPAVLTILAFVIRTALEDRTLQKELDGYSDYAQQVRYRLIPGIW
ncbi:MAG: isoprenylcysteine carboxylmethyltransferase family protein [Anaerolineales bacterium]|nr:isoprenylcysteine carboxylmethyltransferase family protein [Anaerolineales bacterium]